MNVAAGVALCVFIWVVIARLVRYEVEDRADARRLPRIDVEPRRINQVRRDPSPRPKQRAS